MAAEPGPGDPEKAKPFKLLGILDVENTPCARDSILYGALGSVVAGLGHFLLTSRIKRSCDVGAGGFVVVTLGCWYVRRVFRETHSWTTGSTVGIIMQSKGSRKELPEKELKIRFYMKVPTLILKEKATAATEQGQMEKPKYNLLLSV